MCVGRTAIAKAALLLTELRGAALGIAELPQGAELKHGPVSSRFDPKVCPEPVVGSHVDGARSSTSSQRTSCCTCTGARRPPNFARETWFRRGPSGPRQAQAPAWPPRCSGKAHESLAHELRVSRRAALKNNREEKSFTSATNHRTRALECQGAKRLPDLEAKRPSSVGPASIVAVYFRLAFHFLARRSELGSIRSTLVAHATSNLFTRGMSAGVDVMC